MSLQSWIQEHPRPLVGAAAILGGWAWLMTVAAVALSVGIWIFLLNMVFVATR